MTGKSAEAQAMIAQGRADMAGLSAEACERPARPRVLFLLSMGGGAPQAAGADTAADGIIKLAGGVNAVEGYSGYRAAHAEAVIASRADFVLVTRQTVGRWAAIDEDPRPAGAEPDPAGKAGRVLQFDTLLLLEFGPRTPQAATQLAAALHPDLARAQ